MATATVSLTDQAITETVERALTRYPRHAARIERAAALVRLGAVRQVTPTLYMVRASNGERSYAVTLPDDAPATCECKDAQYRGRGCQHVWAAFLAGVASIRFEVLIRRAAVPEGISEAEADRLRFVRWLVQSGRVAA